MLLYLSKKIISLIPLLLGITLMSFIVIHLAPGKPTNISGDFNPKISLEARQRLERLYNLDAPILYQYGHWMNRLLRFDFGRSFADNRPVIDKILEALPITLSINILSLILILGTGIPLGILMAVKHGTLFEKTLTFFTFLAFAMPTFWLALLLMSFFSVRLGWLPVSGIKSVDFAYLSPTGKIIDLMKHLCLPIFISSLSGIAAIARYMRQNMLDVLNKKYMLAAKARALPEKITLYKHGLKNALLPVITILGLSIPGLIGGSVIFESIFAINGTGRLFYMAVMSRDYPVIMAMLVISAILTLIGNLAADIGYALMDPRIRYAKHH
ncbi:MAG: ABC transporter permease [Candidatus Omnitrophota bacterium]